MAQSWKTRDHHGLNVGAPKLPAFGKQLPTRSRHASVVRSVGQSIPPSSGPCGTKGSPAVGAAALRAGALCTGWAGAGCAMSSSTEGAWGTGGLQSPLGISHHPGGSGAPLLTLIPWAMAACVSLSTSVRWPIQGDAGSQLQLLGTLMDSRDGCRGTGSLSAPLLFLGEGHQWEAEPTAMGLCVGVGSPQGKWFAGIRQV